MVNLIWNSKKLPQNFDSNIKKYENFFQKVSLNNNKKIENSNSKNKNFENHLYWGDNLKVAYHLLNKFRDKIKLIYIDPPFFSGSDYKIEVIYNKNSHESLAYKDRWNHNLDQYLQFLYERLWLFNKLLSHDGLIFVHLDWHASHYIRILLDQIFGTENFINSIVWYYYNKYSASKCNLPRAHDEILLYSKSDNYSLNELRIPRKKPKKQLKRVMINGVLKNAKDENGNVIYRIVHDKKMDDVWTQIPCMQPASKQWTGFPTQKHHKLLERIIMLGSNEGDLIFKIYSNSQNKLKRAEKIYNSTGGP
ncbi:MAG: site-specific DNA-methyltransferase, partial [Candidatus Lokiarchaeota archaeon]